MEINEEKREKFINYAGKRVNNIMHDIQILEPMARSNAYDFTQKDVEEMFTAIQETLNNTKYEFDKKFERKAKVEKKVFSFGSNNAPNMQSENITENSEDSLTDVSSTTETL